MKNHLACRTHLNFNPLINKTFEIPEALTLSQMSPSILFAQLFHPENNKWEGPDAQNGDYLHVNSFLDCEFKGTKARLSRKHASNA